MDVNESHRINRKAEELVRAVARAFYTDEIVAVMDMLTKEKYIVKEELAPRLRMSQQAVNAVLARLVDSEGLVRAQEVNLPNAKGMTYYYIDYQNFTNLVRYRVHLVQDMIKNQELSEEQLQCPSCGRKYGSSVVMQLKTRDGHFACQNCCQADDFSRINSEPHFRLQSCNATAEDDAVLANKFKSQMSADELGLRPGIFDLLKELKDKVLLRNTPSDNMAHGIEASGDLDAEQKERIDANFSSRGTMRNAKRRRDENLERGAEIRVEFDDSQQAGMPSLSASALLGVTSAQPDRDISEPEFLRNSRVEGGAEALQAARKLGAARLKASGLAEHAAKAEALAASESREKEQEFVNAVDDWED